MGWRQLFRQIADTGAEQRRLEAWTPRKVQIGTDIPASGPPEAYVDGTPERRLAEVLEYWRVRNFGWMARCLPHHALQDKTLNRVAGELRDHYGTKRLEGFAFLQIDETAPAVAIIRTRLVADSVNMPRDHVVDCRLICEDETGRPTVSGTAGAAWRIYTYLLP